MELQKQIKFNKQLQKSTAEPSSSNVAEFEYSVSDFEFCVL